MLFFITSNISFIQRDFKTNSNSSLAVYVYHIVLIIVHFKWPIMMAPVLFIYLWKNIKKCFYRGAFGIHNLVGWLFLKSLSFCGYYLPPRRKAYLHKKYFFTSKKTKTKITILRNFLGKKVPIHLRVIQKTLR